MSRFLLISGIWLYFWTNLPLNNFTTSHTSHDNSVITPYNLQQLQPVTLAEYDWPLDLVWSLDSTQLAISTPWAVWVHHVANSGETPFKLAPSVSDIWDKSGSVLFSQHNEQIATVTLEGDLLFWQIADKVQQIVDIDTSDYTGVAAISPDLTKWATANWDGSVSVWDSRSSLQIRRLEGHTRVGALAFTPNGRILVSDGGSTHAGIGDRDDTVRLWNMQTGEELAIFEVNNLSPDYGGILSDIAITLDGNTAAIFGFRETNPKGLMGMIYLIDISNRFIRTELAMPDVDSIGGLSFDPTNNILAVNTISSIIFLDSTSGAQLFALSFEQLIHDVTFSPNGKMLAISRETGVKVGSSVVEIWAVP